MHFCSIEINLRGQVSGNSYLFLDQNIIGEGGVSKNFGYHPYFSGKCFLVLESVHSFVMNCQFRKERSKEFHASVMCVDKETVCCIA